MTLTQILESASIGFIGGFFMGASSHANESREILAKYDALGVPRNSQEPLTKKRIKAQEVRDFMYSHFSAPAIVAGAYALIERLSPKDFEANGISANLIAALPASYVGATVGRVIRRVVNREYYHDLKLLNYMVSDKNRAHEYLPKHQKRALEDIFSQVENRTLDDADNILDNNDDFDSSRLIERVFGDDDNAYIPWIKEWAKNRVLKIEKDAINTNYLRHDICETYGINEGVSISTPFVPTSTEIKVFEKNGRNLNIYEGDFEKVSLVISGKEIVKCSGNNPRVKKLYSERFPSDLGALAKRIYSIIPQTTPILLSSDRPLSQEEFDKLLITSYITQLRLGQLSLLNDEEFSDEQKIE